MDVFCLKIKFNSILCIFVILKIFIRTTLPLPWRGLGRGLMQIIHSTFNSPTFNLAAEEYLFFERQDDLLFLYVNEPSVVIGCNQAIRNEVDLKFCEQNEIQVVRRMSGGGAVFHDLGNLNFCFISNKTEGKSALNDDFLKPIVDVLTDLGVPVAVGKRKDLWLKVTLQYKNCRHTPLLAAG